MAQPTSTGASRNIAVFADVNINAIDGSTIWLQSVVFAIVAIPDVTVHLVLRDRITRSILVEPFANNPRIKIIEPPEANEEEDDAPSALTEEGFVSVLRSIDEETPLTAILVRGNGFAGEVANAPDLAPRLWAYLLDRPRLIGSVEDEAYYTICSKARFLIAQSEPQRALLEARVPEANGKTIILFPMVPDAAFKLGEDRSAPKGRAMKLVYAGKYSKLWNVEQYFSIPSSASAEGVNAELVCIGDKIHKERRDPTFYDRILDKLKNNPNTNWLGAKSREETMEAAAGCDFGLCWRSDALNDSVEISTKFLEFSALGLPVFVNRTENYELALGSDYPFFAQKTGDIVKALKLVEEQPEIYAEASRRCHAFAANFTLAKATERLSRLLDLSPPAKPAGEEMIVGLASHDLKFFTAVQKYLEQDTSLRLITDVWNLSNSLKHKVRDQVAEHANVIICEWCCGNAAWYSRNKRPGQKLVIRLHRFEWFTDYPKQVEIANVDAVIVVSEFFKSLLVNELGWPPEKIHVLPQYINAEYLSRKKQPTAEKALGFVGIVSFNHKRFDRAIDVLEKVLERDGAFKLRVRSRMPWEFPWAWDSDAEAKLKYQEVFHRIRSSDALRDAVIFDKAGADMGEWYRNVGYMLSTSETEGCHTSIAEGMAGGALPVLINWEGADTVYAPKYVHRDTDDMADWIVNVSQNTELRERLQKEVMATAWSTFDVTQTLSLYRSFLD